MKSQVNSLETSHAMMAMIALIHGPDAHNVFAAAATAAAATTAAAKAAATPVSGCVFVSSVIIAFIRFAKGFLLRTTHTDKTKCASL